MSAAQEAPQDVPYGYCWCGCGEKTRISATTSGLSTRGEPAKYIRNHHRRPRGLPSCNYIVDPDTGCWNWGLYVDPRTGYGIGGTSPVPAHRLVWERERGPIPPGLQIDHLCRNRACVNPDHLEPVTCAVNIQRGRAAKLTPEQVLAIRADTTRSRAELAIAYGVRKETIRVIRNRQTWVNI